MTRATLLKIAAAVAILGALITHPANNPSGHAQTETVYLALGDSLPAGMLASIPSERGYPALLSEFIETHRLASEEPGNVELINLAEPGETVQSFRENGQLQAAVEEIESLPEDALQTVTLTIGGNNILSLWEATPGEREAELEQFESQFAEVIDELSSALEGRDADVVVTTYYDLTDGDPSAEGSNAWWLRQFNNVIADAASEAGFSVVDLEPVFRDQISNFTWFPADIHPNNAGHIAIARATWNELAYDGVPPSVEITRPDQSEVDNRVPTIHAEVTDDVGIDTVRLQVDGEDERELIHLPDNGVWVGLWDARDFPGNEAELTVTATDVSGNEASDSVTITLPPE